MFDKMKTFKFLIRNDDQPQIARRPGFKQSIWMIIKSTRYSDVHREIENVFLLFGSKLQVLPQLAKYFF